jgi:hypothetical protein
MEPVCCIDVTRFPASVRVSMAPDWTLDPQSSLFTSTTQVNSRTPWQMSSLARLSSPEGPEH